MQEVKRGDLKSGMVLLFSMQLIGKCGATVKRSVTGYRGHSHQNEQGTMNLDSSLYIYSCQLCEIPSSIHPNHYMCTQVNIIIIMVIVIIITLHQYYEYYYQYYYS